MGSSSIASVTLNPALDEAIAIDELLLGDTNRCSLDGLDPGGKGITIGTACIWRPARRANVTFLGYTAEARLSARRLPGTRTERLMDPLHPSNEPTTEELEALLVDEERSVAENPDVPDDVRTELLEDIERRHEREIDEEREP
jgi:hypothetical protein